MKSSCVFLPFWKFMGLVFTWYLFLEGLERLGLISQKSKGK
jgi:hypothetical protein